MSADLSLAAALHWLATAPPRVIFHPVAIGPARVELIVLWVGIAMLAFTFYFRFMQFRCFLLGWRLLLKPTGCRPGEVSRYRAFATSLAGVIGLGNITGVAVAIATGGPGAVFWMILFALLAMPVRFLEASLGVKYRRQALPGAISGGPMHYLRDGLAGLGRRRLGGILAFSYVALALPTMLQMVQVNQSYAQIAAVSGASAPLAYGLGFALLVTVVIWGGLRRIAKAATALVPVMCILYLAAGMIILAVNADAVPGAVATILSDAMAPRAATGGMVGAIIVGMRRVVYSSEIGLGSAGVMHAPAAGGEPVAQGLVALLEPFIDTVVVSTLTALIILSTGAHRVDGLQGVQVTSFAFAQALPGFEYLLALIVFLFALSTIISYGYYFERIWIRVMPDTRLSLGAFRLLYGAALVPGPFLTVTEVIDLMDSLFFLLSVPNIIGLYLLAPEIRRDLGRYLRAASGQ